MYHLTENGEDPALATSDLVIVVSLRPSLSMHSGESGLYDAPLVFRMLDYTYFYSYAISKTIRVVLCLSVAV